MLTLLFTAALLCQAPQAPTPPKVPAAPTFAQIVVERFAAWDRDGNGVLSPEEVDALCVDPKITGTEAAAVAAIKRVVRSGKYEVPPLTVAGLAPAPVAKVVGTGSPAAPAKPAAGEAKARPAGDGEERDADRNDSTERPVGAPLRKPNFQSSFAGSLRKIQSTPRALFADETPDLDKCRQGPLGNCYFVAAVGAYVHRDANDLKQMITPQKGGGYEVRFGSGEKVVVAPLTDAELALSGTTGDEGVWLPVLEKALGTLRREANPTKYAMETATDAIAGGGSSATIVRMLTGKQTERITLKSAPRSNQKDADGKPVVVAPRPAASLEKLAARVRTEVGAALADKRLVTTGTGTEPQPPGISGKHAYAVLGYDEKTDRLRIWNPHGNTFRPKGEPGLKFGYPTAAGVFEVPVAEFVQIFRGVSLEKSGK